MLGHLICCTAEEIASYRTPPSTIQARPFQGLDQDGYIAVYASAIRHTALERFTQWLAENPNRVETGKRDLEEKEEIISQHKKQKIRRDVIGKVASAVLRRKRPSKS